MRSTDCAAATGSSPENSSPHASEGDVAQLLRHDLPRHDNNASPICYSVLSNDCSLETVEFTAHNVGLAMKKLKSSLSCGPDGLPPLLFKIYGTV